MRHVVPFATLCLVFLPNAPLHAQADAGPDQDICLDTTSMQANAPSSTDTAYWSLSTGSATIVDASDPLTLITDIWMGQNILTWTIITPVDTTTDQVSIFRWEFDPAMANAGPDQFVLAPPYDATLNASMPVFPQVCTWSVVAGTGIFSDPNDADATVTSLGVGTNIFQWTCDDGICSTFINADQTVVTVQLATSVGMFANGGPMALWFDNGPGLLHMAGDVQASSLFIMNATGQPVPVRTDRSGATADMSALPPGCYAATVLIGGERRTLRFVVSR